MILLSKRLRLDVKAISTAMWVSYKVETVLKYLPFFIIKLFTELFQPLFPRATGAVLWAEQCDDRAVLWGHLISSTRGAKQHCTVPWYLACAVSGKIATGPTLIAKMPPECVSATSPVPYQETTRECPSFVYAHQLVQSRGAFMCANDEPWAV